MAHGKSVNIYLMDGTAGGRVKCTLANWTGVVYRIPRTMLKECADRQDLRQSGVYLLLGYDEAADKSIVYVGQAGSRKNGEGLLNRLNEHCRGSAKEDYWSEAIAITTSNNSFGPTEISWLEHRLHNLAVKTGRYEVRNANDPTPGNITEEKESELEEFIEYAELAVGVLGCKALTPVSSSGKEPESGAAAAEPGALGEGALLHLGRTVKSLGLKLDARGKQTAEGFAVLKGSVISPEENSKVISPAVSRRRKEALASGNVLQEDLLFGTPSAAASFVIGNSANGWVEWKAGDGRTLKELEQAEG